MIEPLTLLSCVPIFSGLDSDRLSRLGAAGRLANFAANRPLFTAGDSITEAHFLVAGAVKREAEISDHVHRLLEIVRPGQMLALSEGLCAETYASSAISLERSVVISIPMNALREEAIADSVLSWRLLEAMAQRQYATEFEVVSHHSQPVTDRVLGYLLRLAGEQRGIAGETTVTLDASKHLIAARLDIAPETFSRTLRKLSEDGVIVVSGRSVHIQNATLIPSSRGAIFTPPHAGYPGGGGTHPESTLSLGALINLCGRFRMLSQRMATAWGLQSFRIAVEAARVAGRKYRSQYERNLIQVAALPLPPQLSKRFAELQTVWLTYRDLLEQTHPGQAHAESVFEWSERALEVADRLTFEVAHEAASNEAYQVNTAGRNRMLTARVTKLFLFHEQGLCVTETRRLIDLAHEEFVRNVETLSAFSANTPEIMAQLEIDLEQWNHVYAIIDNSWTAKKLRRDTHLSAVLEASESLLRHVDTTVKLYERVASWTALPLEDFE